MQWTRPTIYGVGDIVYMFWEHWGMFPEIKERLLYKKVNWFYIYEFT